MKTRSEQILSHICDDLEIFDDTDVSAGSALEAMRENAIGFGEWIRKSAWKRCHESESSWMKWTPDTPTSITMGKWVIKTTAELYEMFNNSSERVK